MPTVLQRIVAAHRKAAAADERPLDQLMAAALAAPPRRPFRAALAAQGLSVIAEIKRRSPSKGDLAPGLVPRVLAKAYADGGAACLSVLTDERFFGGSPADLAEGRVTCGLPVLRKDFTVSERDVCDARVMGADAVLLIVAALSDQELVCFRRLAAELGLAALIETHDEAEIDRALAAGADIVGVNQRDLRTFEVNPRLAPRLAKLIPRDVLKVAESGVRNRFDAARLAEAGYDAVLVGEMLVTSPDPTALLRKLRGAA